MYIESAIAGYLNNKKLLLPEFKYLPKELWSPTTEFTDRLASYVVKIDKQENLTNEKWIGICFSLGIPDLSEVLGKNVTFSDKNISLGVGSKFDAVFKKFTFEIGVYSSDPYYLIKYIESFIAVIDRASVFQVLFPDPLKNCGLFDLQAYNINTTDFIPSIERETTGSLSKFGYSFDLSIPIVRLKETRNLIGSSIDPLTGKPRAKILINNNIPDSYLDTLCPNFLVI